MKTCTLRKLESGEIICTVDERPKVGEWYVATTLHNTFLYSQKSGLVDDKFYANCDTIIASTISNVGKELFFSINNVKIRLLAVSVNDLVFNKQYECTENENQIIIKL